LLYVITGVVSSLLYWMEYGTKYSCENTHSISKSWKY